MFRCNGNANGDANGNANGNTNMILPNFEAIHAAAECRMDLASNNVTISLKDCHLDTTTAATIIKILCENRCRVNELLFDNCTGPQHAILPVALGCTTLGSLSIHMGSSLSYAFDHMFCSLGIGLQSNSSLQKLTLGTGSKCIYFTLSSDASRSLEEGLRGNRTLSTLHIDNCRFAETGALRIFATGLQSIGSLRDVRLTSCYESNGQPLGDLGIAHLIRALEHSSGLVNLDLSKNKCLDTGMIALASLLDKTQIRTLNVSSQLMDRNECMNTFHLVGALARNRALESLELRSNNLSSDYDMANLAAALTHNTSIKRIDLSDNNIQHSAMDILSSRIPFMKGLENLQIDRNNGFDDETSKNLARAMKENTVIRIIQCDQHLADLETIQFYADLNWVGRRFLTLNNSSSHDNDEVISSISLPLWSKVFPRIGRLTKNPERQANVMYFLLQRGSAMFPV